MSDIIISFGFLSVVLSLMAIHTALGRIGKALEKIAGPGDACNTYGESFLPALTRAISDGLIHGRKY